MTAHEVYPNASVVLVAFEARHPASEPLSPTALARAKKALASELPLLRQATMTTITATSGAPPVLSSEQVPRFTSRDVTTAVSFKGGSVVVETTSYERYERLREVVALALRARTIAGPIDGIERLGLRYIDEVRVPDLNSAGTWGDWVDASLLGPATIGHRLDLSPAEWQGLVRFDAGSARSIVLRYGPREGYAVDPAGDLKRPRVGSGPFFLLDIDSFWSPEGEIPEFDSEKILATLDELHEPVSGLFETLITERLRNEVLRK
jgi:uncharacterized protein (TIGR04255 family)